VSFELEQTAVDAGDEHRIVWGGSHNNVGQHARSYKSSCCSVTLLEAKKLVTDHHSPSKGRIKTMQVGTSGPMDRSPLNGHARITEMRERVMRSTVIAFHSFQSHSKWTKCHQMTLI
jgi:hypothetical protein